MARKSRTHRRLRRSTSKWSWRRANKERANGLDAFVTSQLYLEEQTDINKVLDEMEQANKLKDYYPDPDNDSLFI